MVDEWTVLVSVAVGIGALSGLACVAVLIAACCVAHSTSGTRKNGRCTDRNCNHSCHAGKRCKEEKETHFKVQKRRQVEKNVEVGKEWVDGNVTEQVPTGESKKVMKKKTRQVAVQKEVKKTRSVPRASVSKTRQVQETKT
jgi:hypothetical protein